MQGLLKSFRKYRYGFMALLFILLISGGCGSPAQKLTQGEGYDQFERIQTNTGNTAERADSAVAYNSFLNHQDVEGYSAENLVYIELNQGPSLHFNNARFIPEFTDTNIGSVLLDPESNILSLSLELNGSLETNVRPQRLLSYSVDLYNRELLEKSLNIPALPKAYAGLADMTDQRLIEIAEEFATIIEKVTSAPVEKESDQAIRNELSQEFNLKIRKATEEEIAQYGLNSDDFKLLSVEEYRKSLRQDIISNNIANLNAKINSIVNEVVIPDKSLLLMDTSVTPAQYMQESEHCYLYVKGEVLFNNKISRPTYWCWIENAWSSAEGTLPWFISKEYNCEFINAKSCRVYYKGLLLTSTGDVIEDSRRTAIFTVE